MTAVHTASGRGLVWLADAEVEILARLDEIVLGWARADGATLILPPPMLPVRDLAAMDVYRNFPHLAMVAGSLDPSRLPADTTHLDGIGHDTVRGSEFALPTTVCHGVFAHLRGRFMARDEVFTAAGVCFRNETAYEGLRRLAAFRMREVVAVGSAEHAREHLRRFTALTLRLADELDLPVRHEAASDPFFEVEGPRALWQKLAPVKHEFVVDGVAIASVNEHRNFFGERCSITRGAGEPAVSSCIGFGFERWLHVLVARHSGEVSRALEAVDRAADATCAEPRP